MTDIKYDLNFKPSPFIKVFGSQDQYDAAEKELEYYRQINDELEEEAKSLQTYGKYKGVPLDEFSILALIGIINNMANLNDINLTKEMKK